MTVMETIATVISDAINPAPDIDPEVENAREQLAALDSQLKSKLALKVQLDAAVKKAAKAKAAGDYLRVAAAEIEQRDLAQKYAAEPSYGKLSGERSNLINDFVAAGPDAERRSELAAFLELFELFFKRTLASSRDYRAARASKVAGDVAWQLTQELKEIERKRRHALGV